MKLWNALHEKGRIATIIGFFFALPYNIKFCLDFFTGRPMDDFSLKVMMAVNVICVLWFVLPSEITLSGKGFTFEIKD